MRKKRKTVKQIVFVVISALIMLTCYLPQNPVESPEESLISPTEKNIETDLSHESTGELVRGDNLLQMITREGVDPVLANELVLAVAPHVDMVHLQPGQRGFFSYDNKGLLTSFRFEDGDDKLIEALLDQESLIVRKRTPVLTTRIKLVRGTVDSSLYNAAVDCGMPLALFMGMIQLFSFDVDFQRDIYRGDYFDVAYEEVFNEDGEIVDHGEVVMARLYTRGQAEEHICYRYVNLDGKRDWYDSNGGTVRKELLKTPIHGAYISSGFGQRVSPITGFSHVHRALDFAAPMGTPIMASGNGVITQFGWSDVYGWYIKLRHTNGYETLYAHMSSFGRGLRKGSVVDQGQVIGYVGSTGMSTGPHCHYEVIYYGTKINPATVKFPPGESLSGEDLDLYQLERKSLISSFF